MFVNMTNFLQCTIIICCISKIYTNEFLILNDTQKSKDMYGPSPYNLEDYCNNRETIHFDINSWRGAIFQVGYVFELDGSPKSRKIHKCRINIVTDKDFSLVAGIEHMKIRGSRDASNKWKCKDFVQFYSPARNFVGKIFSVLEFDFFSNRKSDNLCGDKQLDGDHLENIFDLSTDANSFSTPSNKMTLTFHQDNDEKHMLNNSFRIVVTSFRHASEEVECEGKQKCYGTEIYCIDKSFICDGHVNCAFPGAGTDEKLCKLVARKPRIFNMTSIIIISLTSMVSIGIMVCIVSTAFCKLRSRLNSDRRTSTQASASVPLSQYPSAPDRGEGAPPYETVILSNPFPDKDAPELELPPNYESLFPEDPPPPFNESSRTDI